MRSATGQQDRAPEVNGRRPYDGALGPRKLVRLPAKVDDEYLQYAPELVAGVPADATPFRRVALAYLCGREAPAPSAELVPPGERERCRQMFRPMLEAYERDHGRLRRSYFAQHAFAAAALTERDELDIVWGTTESLLSPECVRILRRCDRLSYAAWHRLHPRRERDSERRLCQEMIFSVVTEVLRLLDRQRQSATEQPADAAAGEASITARRASRPDPVLAVLSKELDTAERFMDTCATRDSQVLYTQGMLWGALAMVPLAGLTAVALELTGVTQPVRATLLAVFAAGAVGALVSVLARMTFGEFSMNRAALNANLRRFDLRMIGALRAPIGAVFGVAAYTLLESGLLPVEAPNGPNELFMFAAVAFLAGFSERVAQDMFARSGRGLVGGIGAASGAPTPAGPPATNARMMPTA